VMELNLVKSILLRGVRKMSKNLVSAVVKGMLIGAVVGGSTAYIAGMDLTCKCRQMKKKASKACKSVCKMMLR